MRKLLGALALLLGVLFVLTRFTELQGILDVLRRGNYLYLGLALLVQAGWIYNLSAFYQAVYRVFDMEETRDHMLKLVTAANFLTVIAPSAGLSAIAVFLGDARRRGRSTARVTVACMLYVWFEYVGTLALLMLGLAELAARNNLHWSEIAASLILLAGALGLSVLIYLGMQSANALGAALAWMARLVNRAVHPFLHYDYLPVERAYTFSSEVSLGLSVLRNHPRWVYGPLLLALLGKALLLCVLFLCFKAFQVPVEGGALVAGLSLANLFLIVSPTPAGLGIVEGVLAVALRSLGIPLEDATVVTIAYRGFSFWLPFLVGLVTFRLISRARRAANPAVVETAVAEPVAVSPSLPEKGR
jgi:uncharacterized protein (TIRG00374 family)